MEPDGDSPEGEAPPAVEAEQTVEETVVPGDAEPPTVENNEAVSGGEAAAENTEAPPEGEAAPGDEADAENTEASPGGEVAVENTEATPEGEVSAEKTEEAPAGEAVGENQDAPVERPTAGEGEAVDGEPKPELNNLEVIPPLEETQTDGKTEGLEVTKSTAAGPTSEILPLAEGEEGGLCTVDFIILPEHYGQSKRLDTRFSIKAIRGNLEEELSIPEGSLFLRNMTGDVEVADMLDLDKTLQGYGVQKGMKIGIELRINYYQEQETEQAKYVMPDVLELKIHDGKQTKILSVLVERPIHKKPFIGGFRHKATNVEYHHATSQTPILKKEETNYRYNRETQTVDLRSRSSQCPRDAETQMEKVGLMISNKGDRIVEAQTPYFSSADLYALRLEMTIIIQCHVRGMFARSRARELRKEREVKEKIRQAEKERAKLEAELRHKREIERRIHPRTHEDFDILLGELDAWRVNETNRIQNSDFDQEMKQAALRQLLQKEMKLLQTIDKLKNQARHINRDAKIQKKLEAMAKPKVWAQEDLETTTVHTPFTTRARELMDLYNGLRVPLLTVDERLDVLLHVKWTAKEFDCNLTREIVDLVDREADMLNRGRPETSFKGLRRRLANLFLQFVETPEFNPEDRKSVV